MHTILLIIDSYKNNNNDTQNTKNRLNKLL